METPADDPAEAPDAEPEPSLQYLLAPAPACSLLPDQGEEIASGGEQVYACVSTLTLTGEAIAPAGLTVTWDIRASVDEGWSVHLLPPANNPDEPVTWTIDEAGQTRFTFEQRDPAGQGADLADIDLEISISYRLRLHRPACAMTAQTARLTHDVTVGSADASPVDGGTAEPEPLRLEPALAPVPEPTVAFAGPLNFGDIGATAAGLNETTRTGTVAITVSGLDQACGEWVLQLSASPLTDSSGEPLEGSQLLLSDVDGAATPDGPCDMSAGCNALSLSGGPDAPAARTITLTITLLMPQHASLGAFGTTLDAAIALSGVDE